MIKPVAVAEVARFFLLQVLTTDWDILSFFDVLLKKDCMRFKEFSILRGLAKKNYFSSDNLYAYLYSCAIQTNNICKKNEVKRSQSIYMPRIILHSMPFRGKYEYAKDI